MAVGLDGGAAQVLTRVGGGLFAYEPAWSPDGRTLAYTLSRPAADPDLSWLPVGIICGLDRDTGKGRLLAQGSEPLYGLNEASWSPDGTYLLVTLHQPQLNESRQFTGDKITLARYDLASGTLEALIDDAMSGTLSSDGSRLAFVHINPQDLAVTLMVGNGDAGDAGPYRSPSRRFIWCLCRAGRPTASSSRLPAAAETWCRPSRPAAPGSSACSA